jgi:hypothetical protein
MSVKILSYRGRTLEIIQERDDFSVYYNARLDGVPIICYASSPEQAIAIVKMVFS